MLTSKQSQRIAADLNLDQPISNQDVNSQLNLVNNDSNMIQLDDELEDKLQINTLQQEYKKKSTKIKCLVLDLVFQHIFLVIITTTGFIRLFATKHNFQLMTLISLICEFVTQSAPLMIIQIYNNSNTDYEITTLVTLNITFSIINIADLIIELFLSQLISQDSEF